MNSNNTFQTTTGFCQIHPDKILFFENKEKGTKNKNSNKYLKIVYIFGDIILLYLSFFKAKKNEYVISFFLALIALYSIFLLIITFNYSHPLEIKRKTIIKIKKRKGIFHKSWYEIKYKNNTGKIRKKGFSLSSDKTQKETAIKMMKEEGLIQ